MEWLLTHRGLLETKAARPGLFVGRRGMFMFHSHLTTLLFRQRQLIWQRSNVFLHCNLLYSCHLTSENKVLHTREKNEKNSERRARKR